VNKVTSSLIPLYKPELKAKKQSHVFNNGEVEAKSLEEMNEMLVQQQMGEETKVEGNVIVRNWTRGRKRCHNVVMPLRLYVRLVKWIDPSAPLDSPAIGFALNPPTTDSAIELLDFGFHDHHHCHGTLPFYAQPAACGRLYLNTLLRSA
jgi:hypothetical protein